MSYGTFWPTVQRRISFATNFDPLAVRGFKAFKTVCTHLFVYTQFTGACICLSMHNVVISKSHGYKQIVVSTYVCLKCENK